MFFLSDPIEANLSIVFRGRGGERLGLHGGRHANECKSGIGGM